jgi:hypothetical protein
MVTVQRNDYDSSTVKSSSYNYKEKVLTVHFEHGSYAYYEVSAEDYNAFATADSQGRALNQFIKPNYEFERIDKSTEIVGGKL